MNSNLKQKYIINKIRINQILTFLIVFIPYVILYKLKISLGISINFIDTRLDIEKKIQVLEFMNFFYILIYPTLSILPFLLLKDSTIKEFKVISLINIFLGMIVLFSFPFICSQLEFIPTNILGELLMFERNVDSCNAAFPSFHVIWSLIGAYFYNKIFPAFRILIKTFFYLIIISTIFVGMHSIADIICSIVIYNFSFVIINYFNRNNQYLKNRNIF
jgi:membrane-associated phospholipid phosphatase